MAIGEAACVSVHGANRLGCNSLLDIVVFGRAAALRASKSCARTRRNKPLPAAAGGCGRRPARSHPHAGGGTRTSEIRLAMQRTMQNNCAVFRTAGRARGGLTLKTTQDRQPLSDSRLHRSLIDL